MQVRFEVKLIAEKARWEEIIGRWIECVRVEVSHVECSKQQLAVSRYSQY